jgi:hypothetical protein
MIILMPRVARYLAGSHIFGLVLSVMHKTSSTESARQNTREEVEKQLLLVKKKLLLVEHKLLLLARKYALNQME